MTKEQDAVDAVQYVQTKSSKSKGGSKTTSDKFQEKK
jgi:hypothetical protein